MRLADLSDLRDLPPTLTAEQVAEMWGCSTWAVYAMAKAGECPVTPLKLGRKLVWPTLGVLRSVGLVGNGEGPAAVAGPSVIAAPSPDNEDRGQRS